MKEREREKTERKRWREKTERERERTFVFGISLGIPARTASICCWYVMAAPCRMIASNGVIALCVYVPAPQDVSSKY